MTGTGTAELISLSDGGSSLVVRVLGRHMAGVLPWHDFLDAEVVVASGFAGGRLELCLAPEDLDGWSEALDRLADGEDACWMDDGRAPEIRVEAGGPEGPPVVTVLDAPASGTSVSVPFQAAPGWVEELRERLRQVREKWPSEVVETSPGAYAWRRRGPP